MKKLNPEWLQGLWEASVDGLRLTDTAGIIVAVNGAYCRMAERSREQLVGQPFEYVYPESERARVRQRYLEFIEGRLERPVVERLWKTPSGKRIWVEASLTRVEAGGQPGVLAAFRDITARKKLEQRLRRSRQRARLATVETEILLRQVARLTEVDPTADVDLEAASKAILGPLAKAHQADRACWYQYDPERGVCVRVSEWAASGVESIQDAPREFPLALFGQWAQDLLQGDWIDIADVDRLDLADLRAVLQRRGIQSVLGVPVFEQGRCVGWVALHAVRSKRRFGKRAAREVQALAEVVAGLDRLHRVRRDLERTQQRLQEALRESEQMRRAAERASQAKTQFLAMMSHEIRTPLNGVLGVLSLLEADPLPETVRQHLALARDSASALMALLNDVLDLTRVESGVVEILPKEFFPRQLLEEAVAALAHAAAEKGLVLAAVSDARLPERMRADPARLRQVLLNLLGNAVKFSARGGVVLRADVVRETAGWAVCFRVRDTGPGIAEGEVEKVFEPFYQSRHTKNAGGGVGLGLALSRSLVERMGGRIGVRSQLDCGTEFHVTIPLDGELGPDAPCWQPLSGVRIALRIANAVRREILHWQLAEWGAETVADACEPGRVDAVLVDAEHLQAEGGWDRWMAGRGGGVLRVGWIGPVGSQVWRQEFGCPEGVVFFAEPLRWNHLLEWLGRGPAQHDLQPRQRQPLRTIASGRRWRILVADDNAVNRRIISAMLSKLGCEVEVAADGVETLERLEAGRPDLVLLDLEMPRMSGLEVARRLRSGHLAGGETLPLLALSAHVLPEEIQKAFDAGMDGFVAKPVSLGQLEQALRQHLGVEKSSDPQ